jgi:hypothetical protein
LCVGVTACPAGYGNIWGFVSGCLCLAMLVHARLCGLPCVYEKERLFLCLCVYEKEDRDRDRGISRYKDRQRDREKDRDRDRENRDRETGRKTES